VAEFTFNVALGRVVDLAHRVNNNDPATSAFVVLVLATAGLESDATLKDKTTVADLVSGTTNEVTNAGYGRKTLDNTAGVTVTVDNANDRVDVDMPDQTWPGVVAGDGWSKVVVSYDPDTTSGTDATLVPMFAADAAFTPDGSDLLVTVAAAGAFRAS
jgi:hypothetical protein